MKSLWLLLLLPFAGHTQDFNSKEIAAWQQQAKRVTIIRDNWGVPHVYGKRDADCLFGLAYAQAEDNMEQVEDNFIRAIGMAAQVHGDEGIVADQLVRAFEFVARAKAEYKEAPPAMKAIYDSYAAGLNYYRYKHPQYKPALLSRMEPWYPLAMIRFFYYVNDILPSVGISNQDLQKRFRLDPDSNSTGSNAWAIGPRKTQNGSAMLFLNPHRGVFGNGTFTEIHVESESGWKFSGTTKFGFPIPYMGHNGLLSYGYTVNYPDLGDQYAETFDDPQDPLLYKYGNRYLKAVQWSDTLLVKSGNHLTLHTVRFMKTRHGPLLRTENGKPVAVRLAGIEGKGWFDQWYAMSKASDLKTFRQAVSILSFPYFNLLYADVQGNIFYLYSVASAKRNVSFDWNGVLDGSNPETDWQGYHRINELPQILNPASGFFQSCNSDIAYIAGPGTIDKSRYPPYMIGHETNNGRAKRSLAMLSSEENISFDRWAEMTMDIRVQLADDSLTSIVQELRKEAPAELQELIDTLERWDRLASTSSIGMTVFRELINQHRGLSIGFVPALQKAKETLERLYGSWRVPWGDRMRLQKLDWEGRNNPRDDQRSYPLAGFSQNYGTIFCISPRGIPVAKDDRRKLYHVVGSSYTCIIEMGKKVRARSVMPFGQQEQGPHSEDQAPLFATRQYKDAWFYKADVVKHAERSYHPGE